MLSRMVQQMSSPRFGSEVAASLVLFICDGVLMSAMFRCKAMFQLRFGRDVSGVGMVHHVSVRQCLCIPLCRCNKRGAVGFCDDPRRLNVAITRPRRGLAVVCSPSTLQRGSDDWAAFFAWAETQAVAMQPHQLPPVPWSMDPFAARKTSGFGADQQQLRQSRTQQPTGLKTHQLAHEQGLLRGKSTGQRQCKVISF